MQSTFENLIDDFMFAYMHELEEVLLSKKSELQEVSFQSDEANTDRPLKEFMKSLIESEFNKIPKGKESFTLKICISNDSKSIDFSYFKDVYIEKVFLPNELSAEMKAQISSTKNSVYTNPDLYFKITDGTNYTYRSIELKSTKNNSIPGSSIQQVTPDEWVIFVKHTSSSVEVATGQYIHSVNSKLQFPDRSPRPQVAFNELTSWNSTNRKIENSTLAYSLNNTDEQLKYDLINDWQQYLSDRWIDVLFSETTKTNEPWYNNNLRKFIIKFLDKYETLTAEEQLKFKNMVNSLIK
ncbi:hypothetical protein ABFR46_15425 [Clostridioides difficile]|uniref:hypothetical protein n=1 Tax=Paraclostridium bifermentans TaxID=1490 RepID=UPI0022E0E73B|nr:hypothetical protein [Paraclostridium bifermentans]